MSRLIRMDVLSVTVGCYRGIGIIYLSSSFFLGVFINVGLVIFLDKNMGKINHAKDILGWMNPGENDAISV